VEGKKKIVLVDGNNSNKDDIKRNVVCCTVLHTPPLLISPFELNDHTAFPGAPLLRPRKAPSSSLYTSFTNPESSSLFDINQNKFVVLTNNNNSKADGLSAEERRETDDSVEFLCSIEAQPISTSPID
jgi:hypothetical protein